MSIFQSPRPNSQNKVPQDNAASFSGLLLALEASGEHASVALWQNDGLIEERRSDQLHGHAAHFVTLAADVVKDNGFAFGDVTHIASGIGPGSFTGLRVCLSAAKGFALAGDLPACGVHGLRARAYRAWQMTADQLPEITSVIATADTRRGVLFWQRYDADLNPLSDIQEASREALCDQVQSEVGTFLALPPLLQQGSPAPDQQQEGNQADAPNGVINTIIMSAKDIAALAAGDIAAGHDRLPLDALYVAPPLLGPKKQADQNTKL